LSKRRPSPRSKGYNTRWDRERKRFLITQPLCVMCKREGIDTLASVVDHITPHKGNPALFWSRTNWQALCPMHHNKIKQGIERRGFDRTINASGQPTDPNHPWHRGQANAGAGGNK
jgi:5-methylcytosine-specific restriction enzyme A